MNRPEDTWPAAPAPAAPAPPAARRAPQRTLREPSPAPPPDGALRVAPLPLAALMASAVVLAVVLICVGFAMGRATRQPLAVECRCS